MDFVFSPNAISSRISFSRFVRFAFIGDNVNKNLELNQDKMVGMVRLALTRISPLASKASAASITPHAQCTPKYYFLLIKSATNINIAIKQTMQHTIPTA